jgi:hypothetical protein
MRKIVHDAYGAVPAGPVKDRGAQWSATWYTTRVDKGLHEGMQILKISAFSPIPHVNA